MAQTSKIDTPITRLFGIDYPIIQGGMVWVAGWKLAAAVSKAGGLGLIGTGSMTPRLLEEHIGKAKAEWDGLIGVNIPIMYKNAEELARVTVTSGIKIVFTSAGNPARFTDYFHRYDMIVAHVVPSLKLGLKAAERGVDAIVGEGTEAGGHNGFEEIPTFPLIPRLVDHIDLPVIAAGGIRDGRGMAAALALGADGIQVGTRFACSVESSASEAYKQAIIKSREPATILTLKKLSPTRMIRGGFSERADQAEAGGASRETLSQMLGRGRARKGIFKGDHEEGCMEAGEVAGDIDNIARAGDIVREIITGCQRAIENLPNLVQE